MDFGDILKEWEKTESTKNKKENSGAYTKKANAPQKKAVVGEKRANDMDVWLRRYGVEDKDALIKDYHENVSPTTQISAKNRIIEATIDLHNFTQEEAWVQLDVFVKKCKQQNLKKILIVHGKGTHSDGDPVLGRMVRTFIEQHKILGESGHPKAVLGGSGATWVIIK